MSFYDNGLDEVISDYTVSEEYQGYPGVVHGGVVAAMLDEAVGRVAMINDHHHFMMSVTLEIKYRQPVPIGMKLKIVGRIKRMRGRLGKAVGEVFLPDGSLAVESSLILADIPADVLQGVDFEALGWRIDR